MTISTGPQQPIVTVTDVTKTYATKDGRTVRALDPVSLDLRRGEIVSIVGPSGCGKSTLLMIAAGLLDASSGQVSIEGEVLKGPHPRMGIAFQRDNLVEWRSIEKNVLLPMDLRGLKRRDYAEGARTLLRMTGLEGFEHRYPNELSGGMRQRAALCRALVHEPLVLLMDEPFGAVDSLTREQLNIDVTELCTSWKTTTLFVTHDIEEAVFMADRVIVMSPRPGRIVGEVEVPLARPRARDIRGAADFNHAAMRVRTMLEESGAFDSAGVGL